VISLFLFLSLCITATGQSPHAVTPGEPGLSTERLGRIGAVMNEHVSKEQMIGIFMIQILPHTNLTYGRQFKQLAYQAISD
jgi:hypothetical protein